MRMTLHGLNGGMLNQSKEFSYVCVKSENVWAEKACPDLHRLC